MLQTGYYINTLKGFINQIYVYGNLMQFYFSKSWKHKVDYTLMYSTG